MVWMRLLDFCMKLFRGVAFIPGPAQVRIQITYRGKVPGEVTVALGSRCAPRMKIAGMEKISYGNDRGSHGPVLVSTFRPGDFRFNP